jgi:hypothetical protein
MKMVERALIGSLKLFDDFMKMKRRKREDEEKKEAKKKRIASVHEDRLQDAMRGS